MFPDTIWHYQYCIYLNISLVPFLQTRNYEQYHSSATNVYLFFLFVVEEWEGQPISGFIHGFEFLLELWCLILVGILRFCARKDIFVFKLSFVSLA